MHCFFFVRDVHYPGSDQHSLDSICGRPYDKCTKEAFVEYLGIENPAAPFPTYFILTNNTSQNNYYNQSTFLCNEPVETPYEHQPICYRLVSIENERRRKVLNSYIFSHDRIVRHHLVRLHPMGPANIRSK